MAKISNVNNFNGDLSCFISKNLKKFIKNVMCQWLHGKVSLIEWHVEHVVKM